MRRTDDSGQRGRGRGAVVVASKIATGNQIDFETLSLNRRHLSIVGPSLLLDCLSHSVICPSNSCVCTESGSWPPLPGCCAATKLYTPSVSGSGFWKQ